jgi:G:T/U-mismatch repair DNA glycosylase
MSDLPRRAGRRLIPKKGPDDLALAFAEVGFVPAVAFTGDEAKRFVPTIVKKGITNICLNTAITPPASSQRKSDGSNEGVRLMLNPP